MPNNKTTPSSGQISLSDAKAEIGMSSTEEISFNNEKFRSLCHDFDFAGQISLSNAYGKQWVCLERVTFEVRYGKDSNGDRTKTMLSDVHGIDFHGNVVRGNRSSSSCTDAEIPRKGTGCGGGATGCTDNATGYGTIYFDSLPRIDKLFVRWWSYDDHGDEDVHIYVNYILNNGRNVRVLSWRGEGHSCTETYYDIDLNPMRAADFENQRELDEHLKFHEAQIENYITRIDENGINYISTDSCDEDCDNCNKCDCGCNNV
jgi:hypothetical protein